MDYLNLQIIYDNFTLTIIIIIFLILIFIYIYIIPIISKSFMYHPYNGTKEEFYKLSKKFKRNEEFINFKATDQTKLTGMFLNYHKKADWNDIIFLYSHGNGSWIGALLNSPHIDILSNFGSVFTYDYRQYGLSKGTIDEKGTYSDIMGAWKYLTEIKKIPPNKIIVYGHSMGGAVSTKLVSMLVENKRRLPLALILDGTFSNVEDMGNHIIPGCGWLASYNYDNIKNLMYIDGSLPILVMHSQDDETIPYEQSIKIKENCKCTHVKIKGTHNLPNYSKKALNFFHKITQKV